MMKSLLPSTLLLAGSLLLSSSFMPVSALETTAGNKETDPVFNSLMTMADMRIERLRQMLRKERFEREQEDIRVRQTIATQLGLIDTRIDTLDNRITGINAAVDMEQINLTGMVSDLRRDATALRTRLNNEVAALNNNTALLDLFRGNQIANQQAQINTINANIDRLNAEMTALRYRLTNLENFANTMYNRMGQLETCIRNGSCVARKAPLVQMTRVALASGWSYGLETAYLFTGLHESSWQFCSLGGATNQSRRDFNIYLSGGWWYLSTERDNAWLGDEEGTLYANCLSVS